VTTRKQVWIGESCARPAWFWFDYSTGKYEIIIHGH
jgi:hypothetical protein